MGKKFKDLDLSNAFLFAAALEDPQTCRLVLEIILGRKVPKVKVHTEHTILYNSEFRSVRLDVYAEDEFHVSYDLEMQNQNERNLAKRSRYYQAEMDVSSLKPGEDFNGLKPSCIIYICIVRLSRCISGISAVSRCNLAILLSDCTQIIQINRKLSGYCLAFFLCFI